MTRFMLALTAAALCGPFAAPLAAHAAIPPAPKPSTAAPADAAYQTAHLNGQVMALNSEVQRLEQQTAPGTAYVAERAGVIPTGG